LTFIEFGIFPSLKSRHRDKKIKIYPKVTFNEYKVGWKKIDKFYNDEKETLFT